MTEIEATNRAIEFARSHEIPITCIRSVKLLTGDQRPPDRRTVEGLWFVTILFPSPHDPDYPMSDRCIVEVDDFTGKADFYPLP